MVGVDALRASLMILAEYVINVWQPMRECIVRHLTVKAEISVGIFIDFSTAIIHPIDFSPGEGRGGVLLMKRRVRSNVFFFYLYRLSNDSATNRLSITLHKDCWRDWTLQLTLHWSTSWPQHVSLSETVYWYPRYPFINHASFHPHLLRLASFNTGLSRLQQGDDNKPLFWMPSLDLKGISPDWEQTLLLVLIIVRWMRSDIFAFTRTVRLVWLFLML